MFDFDTSKNFLKNRKIFIPDYLKKVKKKCFENCMVYRKIMLSEHSVRDACISTVIFINLS